MRFRTWLRVARIVCGAGLLAMLAACGGVDSGGTGAPTQSAAAVGTIGGFGSIFVGGVRFDETNATVQDEDGNPSSRAALALGAVVIVDGTGFVNDGSGPRATAVSVRVAPDIVGPVSAIDVLNRSLVVLGQSIVVTAATVFDPSLANGLASIRPADVVTVHARLDPARGRYTATRISPSAGANTYLLNGVIGAVDRSANTFSIGGLTIDARSLSSAESANLAVGNAVRVKLRTGTAVATSVVSAAVQLPDRDDARVEGRIASFTSARQFTVQGVAVDAGSATITSDRAGGASLGLGVRVDVRGRASNGILRASTVALEGDEAPDNSEFELRGAIDSIDRVARTFVLRTIVVDYSAGPAFEGGAADDLATGRRVRVKGRLSADGRGIVAEQIRFD